MCDCPSTCNNSAPTEWIFMKFVIWVFCGKLLRKFRFNLTRIMGTLHEDVCTFMILTFWILLRMRYISDEICTENRNTFYVLQPPHPSSYRLYDNVEEYGRAGHATEDSKARALCMLDSQDYRHSFKISSTSCFSTVTLVTGTRLCFTLYVHCLSCLNVLQTAEEQVFRFSCW
jgi:hypothetical protein